ncbi:MAG: hypothetical protein PHY92_10855, partial [Alphaproteobacteria bacterium]|nr:hypothetical protein [Alphaproteobacteria bacterium]
MSFHATTKTRETKALETKEILVPSAPALREAEAKLAALLAATRHVEILFVRGVRRQGKRRDVAA